MTAYQSSVLEHLVRMAKLDRAYAWSAAKWYAQKDTHQLWAMPELLTKEMQKMKLEQKNDT